MTTTGSISVRGDFLKSILLLSSSSKMGRPLNSNLGIASLGEVFTFLGREKYCINLRGTIANILLYSTLFLFILAGRDLREQDLSYEKSRWFDFRRLRLFFPRRFTSFNG